MEFEAYEQKISALERTMWSAEAEEKGDLARQLGDTHFAYGLALMRNGLHDPLLPEHITGDLRSVKESISSI